jgi:hypothetical protein
VLADLDDPGALVDRLAEAGDDLRAARGMGGQQAMKPPQMEPGNRDEHTELLNELQRIEYQMRGAVAAE